MLTRSTSPDNMVVFAQYIGHLIPDLEKGICTLDIGCGKDRALLHLASRFPDSEFVGYELSGEAISFARGRP